MKTAAQTAVFILIFWLIGSSAGTSVKRFNLLRSDSPYDQALAYRLKHIPLTYRFGRENLTPALAGDSGFSDLTHIPLAAFRGPDALPFLCTGLFSDHIMRNVRNPEVRRSLNERLREYLPFHRISKTPFSGFDAPITFWYRRPAYLHRAGAGKNYLHLPKLYSRPSGDANRPTLFFPTQLYEKKPFFFKTWNGFFGITIHSTRPLAALACCLLTSGESRCRIWCNGREGTFLPGAANHSQIRVARFSSPAPLRLHHDYVYSVEITTDPHAPTVYGYFDPQEADRDTPQPERPFLRETITGIVPDLFSAAKIPAWCRRFNRETGIDPLLFRFIQTEVLWINEQRSLIDRELAVTAVDAGDYLFRIRAEKIVHGAESAGPPTVHCLLLDEQGSTETTLPLIASVPEGEWLAALSVPRRGFLRVSLGTQRQANILVTRVVMEADLVSYLNRFWLIDRNRGPLPAGR